MPLGHALSEDEAGWHPGRRGGVLFADHLNHAGVAVSAAGIGLAAPALHVTAKSALSPSDKLKTVRDGMRCRLDLTASPVV